MVTTKQEVKNWYNKNFYSVFKGSSLFLRDYSMFLNHLNTKPGKRILDIGCGIGHFLKAAEERGLKTFGIEISNKAVEIALKTTKKSIIMEGEAESLPFETHYFDYVVCLGVLEHTLNMQKAIQEMVRVAKDDALFCIMVPNSDSLTWKIKKNKGTEQQEIGEKMMTLKEWMIFLKSNRLLIKEIHSEKWWPSNLKVSNNLLGIKQILKWLIVKMIWLFLPTKYAYQFIFICKKYEI